MTEDERYEAGMQVRRAVLGDTHVDIATEIRIPQMNRRQPLGFGDLRKQITRLV
ncbi:hypothetical protein Pgy4_32841 [Pseudomonas savastanoi pv. glycinea str. race 4]|uniref:Uncharacterized protein n=1 Tax=Pseudomonas savastanoi pv. glycinea str. race 4 TaxID=875330 RepID=F3CEQ4_PSESG|nr:hypothetical protein Pgy4_32841 [Pseudomonas savastanoi pv. glycinea str. race 4]